MDGFWIEPEPVWSLSASELGRAEGVALSPSGELLAVAHAADDRVSVYRRSGDGCAYSERPVWVIGGPRSRIAYPHDVDFSGDGRWLLVANRKGKSLTCYAREPGGVVRFSERPAWRVRGHWSRLGYCDGAKFVPPDGGYVAAVNLRRDTVSFYRRGLLLPSRYRGSPSYVVGGPATRLVRPDGLAFSDDGRLLAVANHGGGTVTVYARGAVGAPRYGPAPVAELGAGRLRYPHSVAFARGGTHLAITDAGSRCVVVYRCPAGAGPHAAAWPEKPELEIDACNPAAFDAKNGTEPKEGGSKGVAFGDDRFAVCSPEFGLRVHRMEVDGEGAAAAH
jgi:DNA-binding beta-propeller fold protein YncE